MSLLHLHLLPGLVRDVADIPFVCLTHTEAEALRAQYREAEHKTSQVETQIREIEEKMNRDFGPGGQFEALSEACIDFKPGGEHSYELCPFKNARQMDRSGNTVATLGNWKGFGEGGHTEMLFDGGQHCWNAGARTLKVRNLH